MNGEFFNKEIALLSRETLSSSPSYPNGKGLFWTDSKDQELPIFTRQGDQVPIRTIPEVLTGVYRQMPNNLSMVGKKPVKAANGKVRYENVNYTWKEYYKGVIKFARSLLELGVQHRSSVNIIACNSPEWAIAFFGTIYADCIASGVYTTNQYEACLFQAENSEAEVIVADTLEQAQKYLAVSDVIGSIKAIVVFHEDPSPLKEAHKHKAHLLFSWQEFLDLALPNNQKRKEELRLRMKAIKANRCCNIVYTSGTTGNPKGVMLSHDNLLFSAQLAINNAIAQRDYRMDGSEKKVSFLPLCHSAGQCADLFGALVGNSVLYFARPDALQGSLLETLLEVRPTMFIAVPRLWEKFEEKIKEAGLSKGQLAQNIGAWARDKAFQANMAIMTHPTEDGKRYTTPWSYPMARTLVLNNVKRALGLDQAKVLVYSAAPLNRKTQDFFCSLDMPIIGLYGMTEVAAASTIWSLKNCRAYTSGVPLEGIDFKIDNPDKEGVGEICMRGRSSFLGYFKNEKATREVYDSEGYVHSGDLGKMPDGILEVTGRIKELIITAGGENIPPILIEQTFQEICPIVSNIMVIGDNRRFLSAIVTLKVEVDGKGVPSRKLSKECLLQINAALGDVGQLQTVEDAAANENVAKYIQKCFDQTNDKAISRAQHVRKWQIVVDDFSLPGGELTSTMKMRRKPIEKKYEDLIEGFYQEPKL